ncbi:MAG TPA: tetratricopeptide repeat protein [Bacteroidales bacterium]|nr:tetratricopeptide repeat protein [Bacteroidales bacterium]HRZ49939.1 tetratricopeptide repeat protein [Bacteroidales bacterium]
MYIPKHCLKLISILLVLPLTGMAQSPPTLPKLPAPPDISQAYRANPYFYEVMTGFPDNNSFYKYDFEEVKKKARHDPAMMVVLGDHYRIGRSTDVDLKKALKEYHKAAAKGNPSGNHRIAYMYADGLGLPKDPAMIMEFLKKSADGGYAPAQYDYALIFLNGKFDQPRDVKKASLYLKKASAQGHRNATELLAMLAFHTASLEAGLPTGLKQATDMFRLVKDTDGEKKLMQQMATFSGLRYYLATFPGFLPDVTLPEDPTDSTEGIRLITELEKNKGLLGDKFIQTYRQELAENILYRYYFAAQGNRTSLLKFLVFCDQRSKWLSPYHTRYTEAAARDFRLTVTALSIVAADSLFAEFDSYPKVFSADAHPLIADRIFVSTFLRENPQEVRDHLKNLLMERNWIVANLPAKHRNTLGIP